MSIGTQAHDRPMIKIGASGIRKDEEIIVITMISDRKFVLDHFACVL